MSEQNRPGRAERSPRRGARSPEEVVELLVERGNAGDLDGLVDLYTDDAVVAYPPGMLTQGRHAIREMWAEILAERPTFRMPPPMATVVNGDVAVTTTSPEELAGGRAQVLRRESDGRWLRHIDQPAFGLIPEASRRLARRRA